MRYLLLLAYRFLFRRKGSMFAAGAAVAATISLIIFNTVVFGGVVDGVERDLGDMRYGQIYITNDKGLLKRPYYQMIEQIVRHPDVAGAAPRVVASVEMNNTGTGQLCSRPSKPNVCTMSGVQAFGIDPLREHTVSRLRDSVHEGRFLTGRGSVVIDDQAAQELQARVGTQVKVKVAGASGPESVRRLRVVGIFYVPGPIGFSKSIIMHQDDLKELLGIGKRYTQAIIVRLRDPSQADSVKEWIEETYRFLPTDDWLKIETVDEAGRVVIKAYREGIAFANTLSYSGMVASGLGVITILMMMVNSKVREIGILRAIGMTGRKVLVLFMLDGAMLGTIGAIIGAAIGSIIVIYLAHNPVALFSGIVPIIRWTPDALPIPMLVGFTISVLASIYPSWKASRYQPEEAMRV